MPQEIVKKFFDFARTSEDIQRQFKNGISYEGIIDIASKKGYVFDEQALQKHLKEDEAVKIFSKQELTGQELTEEELESVAGGRIIIIIIF